MKKLKVGIQGIAGSFHDVAAHRFFDQPFDMVECLTFKALCEALKKRKADVGVMAIENSLAGSILPNYFLLQQYHFQIVDELYLPIHMHLLALPDVTLKEIRSVESHPMAIHQCSEFLHGLNGIDIRESDDTAVSAKHIREKNLQDTGAIANERAAKLYGLNILASRIETHKKNFTRFLLLSPKREKISAANKASIYFELPHEAGTLADILMVFKNNKINLTKIQSVPIIGHPQEYSFHIDLAWKNRKGYDTSLQQLLRQVKNLNILGEYKKATIKL